MTDKKKPNSPTTGPKISRPDSGSVTMRLVTHGERDRSTGRNAPLSESSGDSGKRRPDTGSGTKRDKDR